mmetsp:Transcript_18514/g.42158  ORF Transcript_18514/g.42158 Transcript_18514/m.42158 type:complete len:233 (+) Transcript_18514:1076-1774(+)
MFRIGVYLRRYIPQIDIVFPFRCSVMAAQKQEDLLLQHKDSMSHRFLLVVCRFLVDSYSILLLLFLMLFSIKSLSTGPSIRFFSISLSLEIGRLRPRLELQIDLVFRQGGRLPVVSEQENGSFPTVLDDHYPEQLTVGIGLIDGVPSTVGPPGQRVPEGFHQRFDLILVPEACLDDLELELTDGGEHQRATPVIVALSQGLDGTLGQELVDSLPEGLVIGGVGGTDVGKLLR